MHSPPRSVVLVAVSALVASLFGVAAAPASAASASSASGAVAGRIAKFLPGNPGVPSDPVQVWLEDFESGTNDTPSTLGAYVSATGTSYAADPYWIDYANCNGVIVNYNANLPVIPGVGNFPAGLCSNIDSAQAQMNVRRMADVLGQVDAGIPGGTAASPANSSTAATRANHAITAWTTSVAGPDGASVFATPNDIDLTATSSRFYTTSIDVAEASCSYFGGANNSRLNFFLNIGGTESPVNSSPIRACTSELAGAYTSPVPANVTDPNSTAWGNGGPSIQAGTFYSNGSLLLTPDEISGLGVRVRNETGQSEGNDAAFDNIRILDATPQLDKSFSPARVLVGSPSTLTLTVTNTSELAAKDGWGFTDNLPAGLVIASTPNIGGTCDAITTAPPGGTAITVTGGSLASGEVSCTITVDVTSVVAATYENGADNISDQVGIDDPGTAEVEFYDNSFPCVVPTVFVATGNPTILQQQYQNAGGSTFTPLGTNPGNWLYNAIAFNDEDGYLYAVSSAGGGHVAGRLLRIDAAGEIANLGSITGIPTADLANINIGAFDGDGNYWVANGNQSGTLYRVDLTTFAAVSPGQSAPVRSSDVTYADGYLWGVVNLTGQMQRFDVATGTVTTFPHSASPFLATGTGNDAVYGAAWTYGNGNLGFDVNTGGIVQVAIDDPGSASPTFTRVAAASGPASANNDGTACAHPAILSVVKSASTAADPDAGTVVAKEGTVTWTIEVTNDGPGYSSGFVLDDAVPAGYTDVAVTGATGIPGATSANGYGCTVTGNDIQCVAGFGAAGLAPGASVTFTFTATAPDEAMCLTNVASVLGNEQTGGEPAESEEVETCVAGETGLSLVKTSDATEDTRVGDVVTYTITATNTGDGDYTAADPAVVLDDLSAVLDDATFTGSATATYVADGTDAGAVGYAAPLLSWSGPLAAGESVTLSYEVTVRAGGDGAATNVAWSPADPDNPATPTCDVPGGSGVDPVTGEPCGTTSFELPRLQVTKSADRTDLPAIGESVEYTVTVESVGPGDFTADAPATMSDDLADVLDDATLDEADIDADTGVASFDSATETLSWSGALDAGDIATITYTVTYTGDGDLHLRNTACIPVDDTIPGASNCAQVQIPGAGLSQWKSVSASSDPVVAGTVLTYTLFFANDGDAAADVSAIDDLTHVLDDATILATPATGASTLTVTPVGPDDRFTITGTVPSGLSSPLTVTYSVTVNGDGDRGDGIATNFLLDVPDPDNPPETPEDPTCDPDDAQFPDCTETPIGSIEYSKAVTLPAGPLVAGAELTYEITVHNPSTVDMAVSREDVLTDVVDDAELTDGPESDTASVTATLNGDRILLGGTLPGGETAVISYTVTVNADDERGNNTADNFLVPPGGTPPTECTADSTQCTSTPLPLLTVWKTVDADATPAVAGTVLTYTIHFENTGAADAPVDHLDDLTHVLDDADVTADPESADGLTIIPSGDGIRYAIIGAVPSGEEYTVTYQVTVRPDGERGDDLAANFVLANDPDDPPTVPEDPSTCEATSDDPGDCTLTPIGALSYVKSVSSSDDVVVEGTVLTYTITIANTGQTTMPVSRDDVLTGVLDDATWNDDLESDTASVTVTPMTDGRFSIGGELAADATAEVTYSVTVLAQGDRGDNQAANFIVPPGGTPPEVCEPGSDDCTLTPIGVVEVDKTVDPDSGTTVVAGQSVTYTLTFRNTSADAAGAVDYVDDLRGVLDDASGPSDLTASAPELSATFGADQWIHVTGVLGANQTVTVEYTVEVKADGERGDNILQNKLMTTPPPGTPDDELPECGDDGVVCTTNPIPELLAWKTVSADPTPVAAGSLLTYTLHFRNDGEGAATLDMIDDLVDVVDDATVDEASVQADAPLSAALADDAIAVTGEIPADGTEYTVTYTATVNADGERGDDLAVNYLLDPGEEPPTAPVCQTDPDLPQCTMTPIGSMLVSKSVAASETPIAEGTVLTYTLTFNNQGQGPAEVDHTDLLAGVLDDADLTQEPEASSDALTVSDVSDGQFLVTGTVEGGDTVTVTYQVTVKPVAERGDNDAVNFLVPRGEEPPAECSPTSVTCTETPLPAVVAAKSADPESRQSVVAGQVVTYTLTFRNLGEAEGAVDYTDDLSGVLDDASLVGAAEASDPALVTTAGTDGVVLITGTLQPGQVVTVTYSMKVGTGGGDDVLRNFLIVTGTTVSPSCDVDDPMCTEHPITRPAGILPVTGLGDIRGVLLVGLLVLGIGALLTLSVRRSRKETTEAS